MPNAASNAANAVKNGPSLDSPAMSVNPLNVRAMPSNGDGVGERRPREHRPERGEHGADQQERAGDRGAGPRRRGVGRQVPALQVRVPA